MEGSRPGVMLYFETLQAIEELEAEDTKQIMSAILRYSRDGELPALQGTLAAVWSLIRSGLDRDRSRYGEKQVRGLWLTYCRKCKSAGDTPLSFEEWVSSQHDNTTLPLVERYVNEAVNVASPTTTPSPTPTVSPSGTPSPTPTIVDKIEDTIVSSCAEPEAGSTPPVIELPLNDGSEYGITEEQCREWAELYPSVNVQQQLRNMRGWLLSNKERRKTRRGINRCITNWLSREQASGRADRSTSKGGEKHGAVPDSGTHSGQVERKWGVPTTEL